MVDDRAARPEENGDHYSEEQEQEADEKVDESRPMGKVSSLLFCFFLL